MTATPQSNVTLDEIFAAIVGVDGTVCICGHVNPDGDCIGSTLGLASLLKAHDKDVVTLVAGDSQLDPSFLFMPGADSLVCADDYDGPCEMFVTVDAPDDKRIGESASAIKAKAAVTATIDHHAAPERSSDYNHTDPDAASTTLLVWRIFESDPDSCKDSCAKDVATCCYAGLLTDTGRFMYQNTNVECFDAAAGMIDAGVDVSDVARNIFQERTLASVMLDGIAAEHMRLFADGRAVVSWISRADMERAGAEDKDSENCIGVIRSIEGVQVACMLKEREGSIRGSLRAKNDIDVSEIAREFGGGGHKAAAGFSLDCSLEEAVQTVEDRLSRLLA